jgi:GNAT superfamily N-acetyltransferase
VIRTLTTVSDLEIRQTRFGAPAARSLVMAAQADLAARYGESDQSPVEAIEFDPPEGGFYVAYLGGQPVACAGWRIPSHFAGEEGSEFGDDVAEIKRMYASPTVRGTGVATSLLTAIEDAARERGMRRIILETGRRQPEAMRFYEKNGYQEIPGYGFYKDEPDCVCYGRDLSPRQRGSIVASASERGAD